MKVSDFPSSCETFSNGEVEDYQLNLRDPNKSLDVQHNDILQPLVQNTLDLETRIYPNPTRDLVYIELGQYQDREVQVTIFNNLGQLVHRALPKVLEGSEVKLNLQSYNPGLYYVSIVVDNSLVRVQPLIIQR